MKSSVDEIRQRFDADVERFSNLDTGQSATVDAPLAMALVAEAAAATTPQARHVLDVGCGAGNYTLKPPVVSVIASFFAQQQINDPAAANMRPRPPQVPEHLLVGAAGVVQGVGE